MTTMDPVTRSPHALDSNSLRPALQRWLVAIALLAAIAVVIGRAPRPAVAPLAHAAASASVIDDDRPLLTPER